MNSKSILAPFLAAASALCLMAQPLWAGTFGLFTYTDNGTSITITDYPDNAVGAVMIPATIIGKPVTSIGEWAFSFCTGLTSVSIPNSVTSIGKEAFSLCISLTSISIGAGVTSIGEKAFSNCSGLTAITVDALNPAYSSANGVLFNKNKTTLIQCPGKMAGSYVIPSTVTSIGEGAFSDCSSLTSVSIPNSVTSIGQWAFIQCGGLTNVSIPNSVTSIGDSAFSSCTGLASISIGTGVTSIGDYAFYLCGGLTSVSIPSSVTFIGHNAFSVCSGLISITVDALNSVYSSQDGVLFNKDKTTLILCPGGMTGNYSIPNDVTSIGNAAFFMCRGLTSVSIPHSVTSIGNAAFYDCMGLPGISIPNSVTSIGNRAFSECTGLTSVSIPSSVTAIGIGTFYMCTGLTSVSIPNSVTTIGEEAFSNCTGLTSISIGTGVASIGNNAFFMCIGLTGVSIPNSVISIGDDAFSDCTGLTSVSMPNSVTAIGNRAFFNCAGLTNVSIPNSVTSIGGGAFSNCTGLTGVSIPNSVTAIGERAFYDCSGLASAEFFGNAPAMGESVFDGTASGFTVYYQPGSTGFTTPLWYGYPCVMRQPEIAIEQPVATAIADGGGKIFPNTVVGTSKTLVFTIRNTGTVDLTDLAITKDGTHASVFTITTNPVAPVIPGGTTTFTVRFAPTTNGSKTAAIHIASNDADENPYDITLTGWGIGGTPEIAVQQPAGTNIADGGSKVFPNTTVGTNRSLVFTLKNTGTGNLTGLTITKNGTNASDFTITANPVAQVAPGGSNTFTVRFAPTTNGRKTAAIHIASNDADENPYDITLTGWGIGGAPEIAVQQPAGVNIADGGSKVFPNTTVGTNRSLVFTIRNTGTGNLTGLAITKNGTHASDFTITTNPVAPVIAGAATTFTVRFAPTTKGAKTATIHIASNDANENPYDITLTGWGLAAAPTDASDTLSDLAAGARDTWKTLTTTDPVTGLKYRMLVVTKAPGTARQHRIVEVSPNLIDWYSGKDHTTILRNDASILKVRDNTPVAPGVKRYIRLKRR